MNEMAGAPYVGDATGGMDSMSTSPLCVDKQALKQASARQESILLQLKPAELQALSNYLRSRISVGDRARMSRIRRYGRIDRKISTWQRLDKDDTKRKQMEDVTGKQAATPVNLPLMYSHLNDIVSFFVEAMAPLSEPFFSPSGEEAAAELIKKMNRDAASRQYYATLAMTLRSFFKYNIGGLRTEWEEAERGRGVAAGNNFISIDMYNTMWDASVRNPADIPKKAEWAATVELTNRLEMLKMSIAGEWIGLEDILSSEEGSMKSRLYKEAALESTVGEQGEDGITSTQGQFNWDAYGLGTSTDMGQDIDGFETIVMYAWVVPHKLGLLDPIGKAAIAGAGQNPASFVELWRFRLLDDKVIKAEPAIDRDDYLAGEYAEIPYYMAFLSDDQMRQAQRSQMELIEGFQSFASLMYNIYTNGMRKNVWGLKFVDPTAFDTTALKSGDPVGVVMMKQRGRDIRSAIYTADQSSGVENTISAVNDALALKDRFFPNQALTSQVASIDRAVKSQVATVMQAGTRAARMLVRVLDTNMLLPVRLAAYRNLKKFDSNGIEQITDEQVAKLVGSGIASMEAERVIEALWQLLYAIIQNQEAMQTFDVPKIFTYISRIGNLGVDMGSFVRQPNPPPQQQQQAAGGQPPPPTPEEMAIIQAQGGV